MVIQRVTRAQVGWREAVGRIGRGFVLLVGLERGDGDEQLERAAARVATLRVFDDEEGKMNRGLDEVGGEVLAVSQFTLGGVHPSRPSPVLRPARCRPSRPSRCSPASSSDCGRTVSTSPPACSGR